MSTKVNTVISYTILLETMTLPPVAALSQKVLPVTEGNVASLNEVSPREEFCSYLLDFSQLNKF